MDTISQEIVYHLAELQYELDQDTGQRWATILPAQKQNILSFRATCRAFRNASWSQFRDFLTERVFYLNEDELMILDQISRHPRLAPLVTTLTLGSQIFTAHGLHILKRGLETHPLHTDESGASSPAWQRGLASRCQFSYGELVRFKDLYERELCRQENFYVSGKADEALSNCIYRLSAQNLRAVRMCPRPCHVSYNPGTTDGKLSFTCRTLNNRFVPHGAVNYQRCNGWRNIDRTLGALSKLIPTNIILQDLRTSSMSNVRWPMTCLIFDSPALFTNLRVLQLSIREDLLAADETYAVEASTAGAHAFTSCLMSARNLRSLDLEICTASEHVFSSYILGHLSRQNIPFQLEHLLLEYTCLSAETLADLVTPHASTLKRLVLLNSWLQAGSWMSWLSEMKNASLKLDYLELWKPCEGGKEYFDEAQSWFKLSDLSAVSTRGKVVPFLPQEQWENCFPRIGRR